LGRLHVGWQFLEIATFSSLGCNHFRGSALYYVAADRAPASEPSLCRATVVSVQDVNLDAARDDRAAHLPEVDEADLVERAKAQPQAFGPL